METWQLAARLGDAENYLVVSSEGEKLGRVDHVLYERHHDHPDTIIIRRGFFRRRRFSVRFEAIREVDVRAQVVVLSVAASAIVPLPNRD
jgi:uncharacterized protein YrrD